MNTYIVKRFQQNVKGSGIEEADFTPIFFWGKLKIQKLLRKPFFAAGTLQ